VRKERRSVAGSRRSLRVVPSDTLGALIRARRLTEDLTQAQLATHFGVRQQTVGAWERGERPQPRFWRQLAEYLELSGGEEALEALLDSEAPVRPDAEGGEIDGSSDGALSILIHAYRERQRFGKMSDEEVALFRAIFEHVREETSSS
jgi:transcriptional regulator with XRE-family HTH domain